MTSVTPFNTPVQVAPSHQAEACLNQNLILPGQCHCGNLEHKVTLPAHQTSSTACVCRCAFCRLHQPLWLGVPASNYYLRAEDPSAVSPYRLGHPSADYILCPHCGVVMCALTRCDGHWLAMVNTVTLVLPSALTLDEDVFHPGNETAAVRKARRLRAWIPQVSFSTGLSQHITVRPGGYDGEF